MIRREDFTQPTVDPEPQDVSGVCVYLLIFHPSRNRHPQDNSAKEFLQS
jgi:hypothetical protein